MKDHSDLYRDLHDRNLARKRTKKAKTFLDLLLYVLGLIRFQIKGFQYSLCQEHNYKLPLLAFTSRLFQAEAFECLEGQYMYFVIRSLFLF